MTTIAQIAERSASCAARITLAALLAACAVGSRTPASSAQNEASSGAHAQSLPAPAADRSGAAVQPLPSTPTAPSAQPQPGASPFARSPSDTGALSPQHRALAAQSAASDIESSQRELDVAAGDCRNACRALGSMDRAAGTLCSLTQGDPDPRRCDEAKHRVYSARDRVRTMCGHCAGGPSVEPSAPIPSLR